LRFRRRYVIQPLELHTWIPMLVVVMLLWSPVGCGHVSLLPDGGANLSNEVKSDGPEAKMFDQEENEVCRALLTVCAAKIRGAAIRHALMANDCAARGKREETGHNEIGQGLFVSETALNEVAKLRTKEEMLQQVNRYMADFANYKTPADDLAVAVLNHFLTNVAHGNVSNVESIFAEMPTTTVTGSMNGKPVLSWSGTSAQQEQVLQMWPEIQRKLEPKQTPESFADAIISTVHNLGMNADHEKRSIQTSAMLWRAFTTKTKSAATLGDLVGAVNLHVAFELIEVPAKDQFRIEWKITTCRRGNLSFGLYGSTQRGNGKSPPQRNSNSRLSVSVSLVIADWLIAPHCQRVQRQ
jgi:hypothetical protein